ncbi:septal ring lytic transglycosylase RlpA family protein [Pseudidiomarina sediminum]|uniref:Endolytic peptidoglycan transglycosylase RlpA n=1 Tax=Pseudidiomarina sediminum TaxID=431675 RepID=A0A432Z9W7_9GAMM|nr:septal ring lytic transglycosylase RlpA family protein [Pseudidiomarina sediminum]RUO74172.1 septal ring lytic transglycosylase RlpA family protein [Pseudidiomarina sediminum]
MIKNLFGLTLALLVLSGCSSLPSDNPSELVGYKQSGKASFYAMKYQSRTTANGERFDQGKLTAAHRELPFGTKVKVTNPENGKSVVVRINDRGPFIRGRIIDLSRTGFSAIGNLNDGVIPVTIEVVN